MAGCLKAMASKKSKQVVIIISMAQTPANTLSTLVILTLTWNIGISQQHKKYTNLQYSERARHFLAVEYHKFVQIHYNTSYSICPQHIS